MACSWFLDTHKWRMYFTLLKDCKKEKKKEEEEYMLETIYSLWRLKFLFSDPFQKFAA